MIPVKDQTNFILIFTSQDRTKKLFFHEHKETTPLQFSITLENCVIPGKAWCVLYAALNV